MSSKRFKKLPENTRDNNSESIEPHPMGDDMYL